MFLYISVWEMLHDGYKNKSYYKITSHEMGMEAI